MLHNSFSDEVVIDFHMFCLSMHDRISNKIGALILSQRSKSRQDRGILNSFNRDSTKEISATTLAIPWYSNSTLEWETTRCLEEDHEIKLGPIKVQ